HHVLDSAHRARRGWQLVQRHDLRGYRSGSRDPGTRLARTLYQPALWMGASAGELRRVQETTISLGKWWSTDPEEALAPLPARLKPARLRPEARVHGRLVALAGRRNHRCRRRNAQSRVGPARHLLWPRHPGHNPDAADD